MDRGQLTALEKERKKELEKLMVERESLRQREQNMMDEVKKMEMQLVDQERHFKFLRESHTTAATKPQGGGIGAMFDRDMNDNRDLRRKEVELARDRGVKVVEFQSQRDRLERERLRIMDDLEKLKGGGQLPSQQFRKNDAARHAAET